MAKPMSRTFAFLGLGGKSKAETDKENEEAGRAADGASAESQEDEDEEDEDEEEDDSEDDRKAKRGRNALRAAGHRRGVAAAHARVAAVMNGLEPAKVEMALALVLDSEMTAAQIRNFLGKAPAVPAVPEAGASAPTPFQRMMTLVSENKTPGFGAEAGAGGKPTASGRMAKFLEKKGL